MTPPPSPSPYGTPLKLSSPATSEYWEIPVPFEDDYLLAVDKPAGLLTSPDRYDPDRPNLMRLLHSHITRGVPWAATRHLGYLSNAHRLDRPTSGILLLAKTKPVLVQLASLFGSEKPVKTYLALVQGTPKEAEFTIDAPLAPHPTRPGVMTVHPRFGKRSRTEFRIRQRYLGCTLLECRPLTGRTHQIRVHAQWAKCPLVGDATYGGRPLLLSEFKRNYRLRGDATERPLIDRAALHAARLQLNHPVTGEPLDIECPLPKDLRVALKYLDKYALSQWGASVD